MDRLKERLAHIGLYVAALLKWVAVGALVGGVGGFVGAAFHLGVGYATEVRQAHPWILYLLPLGGVVIAGLYKLCKLEGKGTNAVIESGHLVAHSFQRRHGLQTLFALPTLHREPENMRHVLKGLGKGLHVRAPAGI